MSRAWVDMDSPHSPLSPPIPYRQPSYSDAQRRGSLSPPIPSPNNGFPFKPSQPAAAPPPAAPAVEEDDDGGWGVDVDPAAHQKRMKKFERKNWTPGQPTRGITQTFGQPPRQYQAAPQQQQQQQQQRHQPPAFISVPAPAPAPNGATTDPARRDGWQKDPTAAAPSAQPATQSNRSSAPSAEPSSPAPSSRSGRSGRINAFALGHISNLIGLPTPSSPAPPAEKAQPPAPISTPAPAPAPVPAAAGAAEVPAPPKVPIGQPYSGRIDRVDEWNDPNRAVLTNPKRWGQPVAESAGPVKPEVVSQVEASAGKGNEEAGKGDEGAVSDGGWGEDAPAPTPAAVEPAAAAEAPAAVAVEQEAQGSQEPSDGGWGEDAPAPTPVAPAEVSAPAPIEKQEPSDGGWGEDAPKPSPPAEGAANPVPVAEEETSVADPAEKAPAPAPAPSVEEAAPPAPVGEESISDGGWGATPVPSLPEDVGPDGGWVESPRVRSWVRSTTPVAEPPQAVETTAAPAPVVNFIQGLAVDAEAHAARTATPPIEGRRDPEGVEQSDLRRPIWNEVSFLPSQIAGQGKKWKRDPHPGWSPAYFNRRVLIKFPFPVRTEALNPTLREHLSQYGLVRAAHAHEPRSPENADQAIVVFEKEESLDKCFADPKHTTCLVKSGARADIVPMKINVTRASMFVTAKAVYIKFTGQRTPADAPPLSPSIERTSGNIPPFTHIDAVPVRKRNNTRLEWWAHVRPVGTSIADVAARSMIETGLRAEPITTMDMGPDVAEKDIVPELVDYFADIVHVQRHTMGSGGWLVVTASVAAGRSLLVEITKIPGILARWASPLEELGVRQLLEAGPKAAEEKEKADAPAQPEGSQPSAPTPALEATAAPKTGVERPTPPTVGDTPNWQVSPTVSPVVQKRTPVKEQPKSAAQPREVAPTMQLPPKPVKAAKEVPAPAVQPAPRTVQPKSTAPPATPAAQPTQSIQPTRAAQVPPPTSSHLTKRLVPTYKGRTLREDASGDAPKFFDDAAVFVSGLVKGSETENSLFQGFSRYGQVCGVVYRPNLAQGEFGGAKVMFNSKAAADRALQYEQGAISFGSALKLEKRRVLASDVQLEEKLVDEYGRAYSPSLASQYSPPQLPVDSDGSFVQPPPLVTGPVSAAVPMFWMPFPASAGSGGVPANQTIAGDVAAQPITYALCAYYPAPGQPGAPPAPSGTSSQLPTLPSSVIPSSAPVASETTAPTASEPPAPTSPIAATAAHTHPSSSPNQHQRGLLSKLNGANGHSASAGVGAGQIGIHAPASWASPTSPAAGSRSHPQPISGDRYAEEAPQLFDHHQHPRTDAHIPFNPPANDSRTTSRPAELPPHIVQARPFVPSYQYQPHSHYQDDAAAYGHVNSEAYYPNVNGNGNGDGNGEFGYQQQQQYSQDAALQDGRWQHSAFAEGGVDGRAYGNAGAQGRMGYGRHGGMEGQPHWEMRGGRGGRGMGRGRF